MNLTASNPSSWYKQLRRPSRGATDLVFAGLVRGTSAPLAFVANILIARLLGPHAFGSYITLFSAVLVMGGISEYGVGSLLTREIAATPVEKHRSIILAMSTWALSLTGVLCLVSIILLLSWTVLLSGEPSHSWSAHIAAASIIPTFVGVCLVSGILGGLSLVAKSQAIGNALKNILLLLGVGVLFFTGAHQVADIIWLQAISFALALMVGIYWVNQAIRTSSSGSMGQVTVNHAYNNRALHSSWRHSAGHFVAISAAILIFQRADVVIVNALSGTLQAGIFGAAARLAQVTGIAGLVWVAWLQPRVSNLFQSGQKAALRKVLKLGLIGAVGMTGALILAGWFLAPWIMALMGTGFEDAVAPFRWLLLGYLAWAVSIPFYVMLGMTRLETILSKILWGQLAVTLIASYPLVHFYGALGGAWAWAGGQTLGSAGIIGIGYFYRVRGIHHAV